jgi:hypothetical protein
MTDYTVRQPLVSYFPFALWQIGSCSIQPNDYGNYVPTIARCPWATDELYWKYHDEEWGTPSHEDQHLFEMLILEGAQAGLSWSRFYASGKGTATLSITSIQ